MRMATRNEMPAGVLMLALKCTVPRSVGRGRGQTLFSLKQPSKSGLNFVQSR